MSIKKAVFGFAICMFVVGLVGCGGGGKSSSNKSAPPDNDPPEGVRSLEDPVTETISPADSILEMEEIKLSFTAYNTDPNLAAIEATIERVSDTERSENFEESKLLFDIVEGLNFDYEIRLNEVYRSPLKIDIVPPAYLVNQLNDDTALIAYLYSEEDLLYNPMGTRYSSATGVVTITLPAAMYTPSNGYWTATIKLAVVNAPLVTTGSSVKSINVTDQKFKTQSQSLDFLPDLGLEGNPSVNWIKLSCPVVGSFTGQLACIEISRFAYDREVCEVAKKGANCVWKVRPHLGTDFRAEMNTPVHAMEGGKVVAVLFGASNFNTVTIANGSRNIRYLHLNSHSVEVGDIVAMGDVIGLSGKKHPTTTITPHLHVAQIDAVATVTDDGELRMVKQYQDIFPYLVDKVQISRDPDGPEVIGIGDEFVLRLLARDVLGNLIESRVDNTTDQSVRGAIRNVEWVFYPSLVDVWPTEFGKDGDRAKSKNAIFRNSATAKKSVDAVVEIAANWEGLEALVPYARYYTSEAWYGSYKLTGCEIDLPEGARVAGTYTPVGYVPLDVCARHTGAGYGKYTGILEFVPGMNYAGNVQRTRNLNVDICTLYDVDINYPLAGSFSLPVGYRRSTYSLQSGDCDYYATSGDEPKNTEMVFDIDLSKTSDTQTSGTFGMDFSLLIELNPESHWCERKFAYTSARAVGDWQAYKDYRNIKVCSYPVDNFSNPL